MDSLNLSLTIFHYHQKYKWPIKEATKYAFDNKVPSGGKQAGGYEGKEAVCLRVGVTRAVQGTPVFYIRNITWNTLNSFALKLS